AADPTRHRAREPGCCVILREKLTLLAGPVDRLRIQIDRERHSSIDGTEIVGERDLLVEYVLDRERFPQHLRDVGDIWASGVHEDLGIRRLLDLLATHLQCEATVLTYDFSDTRTAHPASARLDPVQRQTA